MRKAKAKRKTKPMSTISAKVIPHAKQRYNTLGDYWGEGGVDQYRVSDLGNPAYNLAVLVHELVEWELCKLAGIREQDITKFDKWFEDEGLTGEPGDDLLAPYRAQHQLATDIERAVIAAFGESWMRYEDECRRVSK